MSRAPGYLDDGFLAEIAGRLRFGGQPLEEKIGEMLEPQPAPWSYPSHPQDSLGEMFGLRGFEFNVLQQEALKQMHHNSMLRDAYRKFLMIAKLTCEEGLEKVRAHERHQAEDKMKRDAGYRSKKASYDGRVRSLTKSWTEVRSTIKTRWKRAGRSIMTMLQRDSSLGNMTPRDRLFVEEMERRGVASIDRAEGRVSNFNWEKYEDFSVEDINEVIQMLDRDPSGGFIKKPTIKPL